MDSWIAILPAVNSGVLFDLGLFWDFVSFLSLLRFSNFVLVVLLQLHGYLPFVSVCVIRDGRNCSKVWLWCILFPVALCSALPLPQKSLSCGLKSGMPAFLTRINQCEKGSLSFLFFLLREDFQLSILCALGEWGRIKITKYTYFLSCVLLSFGILPLNYWKQRSILSPSFVETIMFF